MPCDLSPQGGSFPVMPTTNGRSHSGGRICSLHDLLHMSDRQDVLEQSIFLPIPTPAIGYLSKTTVSLALGYADVLASLSLCNKYLPDVTVVALKAQAADARR